MKVTYYEIEIDGKKLPVYITYKRTKNIIFKVERDGSAFKVSCPPYVSSSYLISKINESLPRLYKKVDYEKPIQKDSVYIFGELEEVPGYSSWEDDFKKDYLSKTLLQYVESRVRYYEDRMMIFEPYKVAVRDMKSRYGVNSRATHKVTFTSSLIHYSPSIIDSVVVHELAHHFVFNHSEEFYNVVYRYFPNYKEEHDKLRKHQYK